MEEDYPTGGPENIKVSVERLSEKRDPDVPGTRIKDNDSTSCIKRTTKDQEKSKCDSSSENSTEERLTRLLEAQYAFAQRFNEKMREVENCSFEVCEELFWEFDGDCIKSVDNFWNVPCIPTLSKAFIMKDFVEGFSASNEMIMCCYISNSISDFINLDALSLPFEKVPWGAENKEYSFLQKDGSYFCIQSVNMCLFIGFLYLDAYFLILDWENFLQRFC
ncbi:hypothetical protein STEG23_004352 [Scotinomys teguina]